MNANNVQQAAIETQLIEASKAWSIAFYSGDAVSMDNLEHQGVIIIDDGVISSKTQPRTKSSWPLLNVKSHSKVFDKVHLLGEIGLLIGNLTVETNNTDNLAFTEVWRKLGNQWLVFAAHFSQQRPK